MKKLISCLVIIVMLFLLSVNTLALEYGFDDFVSGYKENFQPYFKDIVAFPAYPEEWFSTNDRLILRDKSNPDVFLMLLSEGGRFEYVQYWAYLINRDFVSGANRRYKIYKFDKSKPIKEWVYHSSTDRMIIGPQGGNRPNIDDFYYEFYYVSNVFYNNTAGEVLIDKNSTDYIRVSLAIGYFQYYFYKYKNQILSVAIGCMSSLILLRLLGRWSRNKNDVIKSYKRKYRGGKKIWKRRKKFY